MNQKHSIHCHQYKLHNKKKLIRRNQFNKFLTFFCVIKFQEKINKNSNEFYPKIIKINKKRERMRVKKRMKMRERGRENKEESFT